MGPRSRQISLMDVVLSFFFFFKAEYFGLTCIIELTILKL